MSQSLSDSITIANNAAIQANAIAVSTVNTANTISAASAAALTSYNTANIYSAAIYAATQQLAQDAAAAVTAANAATTAAATAAAIAATIATETAIQAALDATAAATALSTATTAAAAATAAANDVLALIAQYNLISNTCFPAGTLISTNLGKIAIDLIDPTIHTIRNKTVVAITRTVTPDRYLVCIEKGAFGSGVPSVRTVISRNHKIMYDGKMRAAKELVGLNNNITHLPYKGEILYNVLMEEHDKMVVNNLICETLHPKCTTAQIYRILPKLNAKQQLDFIRDINKEIISRNIYGSSV